MLRRLIPYTCATVAIVAALVAMLPAVSTGAGASILIQANIVSATSLTNGCTSPIGFQFGTVQPGSNLTTATTAGACRFTFGSTNDSASLRIGQRDGSGTAMGRSATSWIGTQDASITSNDAIALTISAGWTVGPNGIMQRTLDGGATWTQYGVALTGTGDWLTRAAVEAGSTTTFYTAGGNGNVTKVTNATSTTPTFTNYVGVLAFPAGSVVRGIYSPATNVVFIVATNGSTVYVSRSGTGGTSFAAPFTLAGATRAIDMGGASASDFWIVGSGAASGIFRTTTGGATTGAWSELASPNRYWGGISMSATNDGYLSGSGGEVWRWNGTTWSQVASPSSLTMRSVAAVPGSPLVAWVAGTNADAYRTIDGGTTWTRVDSGTSGYLWGIASVDSTHAILAGDDRWAGWTHDGTTIAGSTQDPASYSMADVASVPTNGQVLVSVGGAGLVRRSTNMGSSWTTIPSGTTRSLRS
ncbi:MAG: hypothetical protein H7287_04320, partial [Thermoleophilia bacterium]|nr:hypothetical protein [Thermoleophilia bacterium]